MRGVRGQVRSGGERGERSGNGARVRGVRGQVRSGGERGERSGDGDGGRGVRGQVTALEERAQKEVKKRHRSYCSILSQKLLL